jgi:membrane protease YdiL (CAAX protease family)
MKKLTSFLLITLILSWSLQLVGAFSGNQMLASVLLVVVMLTPLLAVLITHRGLKMAKTGIGWKPQLKKGWKWYLLAWWSPAALTAVGAALYFVLFPGRFDPGMGFLAAQTEALGSPMPAGTLVLIQTAAALLYAPFINMLVAVGEEVGWRGYLTPALTERFGKRKALLLSGVIWGMFHWPIILLSGYEYGTGYWGAPWLGLIVMLVFTTAYGILLSWLYEKTGSIWSCALCHGALNAVAGLPLYFLPAGTTGYLLGPTIAGPIAGLPMILWAVWLWSKAKKP